MKHSNTLSILRVVLEIDKCFMTVLCEYKGLRKNIKLTWKQRGVTNVPPEDWKEKVRFEMEDILSQIASKKGFSF